MHLVSEKYISQTEGAVQDPFVFNNPFRINQFSHVNFTILKNKTKIKNKNNHQSAYEYCPAPCVHFFLTSTRSSELDFVIILPSSGWRERAY